MIHGILSIIYFYGWGNLERFLVWKNVSVGYHICNIYTYLYWIIGLFMYYLFAMDDALYVDRWIGR
jgi:hypothetical protein